MVRTTRPKHVVWIIRKYLTINLCLTEFFHLYYEPLECQFFFHYEPRLQGDFFSRLFHSLESKCLSVCMHVITAERLFMKFRITGFLGSILRQFRVYWNQIILTTIWREILLTQHDVLLEGNLYVYMCSQFQLCPEKKLSRSDSDSSHRAWLYRYHWITFHGARPIGQRYELMFKMEGRGGASWSLLDPKHRRQIKYFLPTFPGLFKNYSSEGVHRFFKSLGTTSKF